jgi:surfactin synthase thioesterase subunit
MKAPWFTRFAPRPSAQLRLFCFSHAGGGGAIYRPWALAMPADIEVIAVVLPGRESRLSEPPLQRMADLLGDLQPALEPELDRPFAFFGHSMGALIAYELACGLQANCRPAPRRLLLSGLRAPHLPQRDPPISHLDDEAFVAEVRRRYDGIPAEVMKYPMLLEILIPALRADMQVIESYRHSTAGWPLRPFEGPISAFGGDTDARVPRQDLGAWQANTSKDLVVRQFPGGHFYLNERAVRDALVAAVVADLRADLADPA